MRVAFFGTPAFAVPSLRALLEEGFDVQLVISQPDRPQGRSRSQLVPPEVKRVALEEGLPVLQPERPVGAFAELLFHLLDLPSTAVRIEAFRVVGVVGVRCHVAPAARRMNRARLLLRGFAEAN